MHWSIVSHWADGNETNDGIVACTPDDAVAEESARKWARRMLGVGGVTGVMITLWSDDYTPRMLRREQVYPEAGRAAGEATGG